MDAVKRKTVDLPEAARVLGISRSLIYKMAKNNQIPTLRLGAKRLVVPVAALEAILKGTEDAH